MEIGDLFSQASKSPFKYLKFSALVWGPSNIILDLGGVRGCFGFCMKSARRRAGRGGGLAHYTLYFCWRRKNYSLILNNSSNREVSAFKTFP